MAQKILHLGPEDWMTGTSIGQHIENSGIFSVCNGINPFVDPFLNSNDFGLLQAYKTETNIGLGTVTDSPVAFVPNITGATTAYLYVLGGGGKIYAIDLTNDAVTLAGTAPMSVLLQNGFISGIGGTRTFYYINNNTQLGSATIGSPTLSAFSNTLAAPMNLTLQNTAIHPIHYYLQTYWIGDKDRISKVYNNAGVITASGNVLQFDPEYTVTAITDDDVYLVIGASTQTTSIIFKGTTKVYFWDTFTVGSSGAPAWNKEWTIPESFISCMKKVGNYIYAICGRALYAFTYTIPPTKILDLDSAHAVSAGNYNACDRWGDAFAWGSTDINIYGKLNARMKKVFATPMTFNLRNDSVTALDTSTNAVTAYVGTNSGKIYSISKTSGGSLTSIFARTHFFNLGETYDISSITIVFGSNLATGDDVSVKIVNRNADVQTISATFAALGAISKQNFPVALSGDNIYLEITFNAGNPKIKDIILYGEKSVKL